MMGNMATIINLKDKKRSWALFPQPQKQKEEGVEKKQEKEELPSAPPRSSDRGEQKIEIMWEAPEYVYHPKSLDWYWGVGIVSLALILIAIFTRNLLFAIFAAVAGFTVAIWGARKPKTIAITLGGNGITIETRLYPYQELVSFWIHYNSPIIKEINVVTKSTFLPYLRIPIGNENPAEIRAFLTRFLPEKIQEESLIDIIARVLKF